MVALLLTLLLGNAFSLASEDDSYPRLTVLVVHWTGDRALTNRRVPRHNRRLPAVTWLGVGQPLLPSLLLKPLVVIVPWIVRASSLVKSHIMKRHVTFLTQGESVLTQFRWTCCCGHRRSGRLLLLSIHIYCPSISVSSRLLIFRCADSFGQGNLPESAQSRLHRRHLFLLWRRARCRGWWMLPLRVGLYWPPSAAG